MSLIDSECEKRMIQFIYYHKAAQIADLDTVWKEFLRINPLTDDEDIDLVSELKVHFLCLDRDENKWGLDEEVFLYFKYGQNAEEWAQEVLEDEETDQSTQKLLVTFPRKQNYNTGMSYEGYLLCKDVFSGMHE